MSTPRPSPVAGHSERLSNGRQQIHLRRWDGPAGAPWILLVHGYPDCSHVWDAVAPRLAQHFRVAAYDVRGAGASTRPQRTADYRLSALMSDLACVLDALEDGAPIHLVGHDWGSIQSWEAATDPALAARLASFSSISGPCLDHVGHWLAQQWARPGGRGAVVAQARRSWYIALFHLPLLAPVGWRVGLGRAWPRLLTRMERHPIPASPTQAQDGATGVRLYRANVLPCLRRPRARQAQLPVQLIRPRHDPFVSAALLEAVQPWVAQLHTRDIEAGHWAPLSASAEVATAIAEFVDGLERQAA